MRKKSSLFLVFWFGVCLLCQAQDRRLKITIVDTNIPIRELFARISQQSGFDFSYNSNLLDAEKSIAFSVKRATLEKTLKVLTKQLFLDFEIVDGQIVLLPSSKNLSSGRKEETDFHTLSGFVKDEYNGEYLIGATVTVLGTSRGVVTNAFGYYSIQLEKGLHLLSYSYLGYEASELELMMDKDQKQDVILRQESVDLPNVIVALNAESAVENNDLDQMKLRSQELEQMPEFGGESGLVKGLQSLPGVKMHSDGSAFFYVRGGEKDQNLIIIDDAPIYNPAHLFGFYSMVIPDFTKEIKVYKSDVPSNLGDRLSSIVSIRTKDGNLQKTQFSGALNPLINRFSLEIPTGRERGSIFTSLRRSNFEWLYQKENPDLELAFSDFSFKWNFKVNNKNRIFLTLITGVDGLNNQVDTSGVNWANVAATFRWNHIFGPKLFSNTTIYSGSYTYRLSFVQNSWESAIGTLSLKSDFTHYIKPSIKARFGFEIAGYGFNPGTLATGPLISFIPQLDKRTSRKRVLYYQAEFKPKHRWRLDVGGRLTYWDNLGPAEYYTFGSQSELIDTVSQPVGVYQTYVNFDPRLSLRYQLDSTTSIKLSYGNYHQYLQLITNSVSPFTSLEVWLPSSPNIRPQAAQHVSLGILRYFPKSTFEFSATAYYKHSKNQIDYVPHANTILNPLLEGELRFGTMDAYGTEFLLKKNLGRIRGWFGYTWSRALRKTAGINEDRIYPAFQDRPHDFSLMVNYQVSRRTLFSTYWTSSTGSAFSTPTGFYQFNHQTVPIYTKKNNDRLPNYRRLDVAIKFKLNKNLQNRFQHSLTLSVYNVLAHKNVVAVNFNKVLDPDHKPVVPSNYIFERDLVSTQTDLIRFLPSLTYKFKI